MTLFSVRYCEWCGKQKEPINTCRCEENWTKTNTNLVTAEEGDDKSVLDLLANLARRVTELERQQKENRELIIKAFEGISGKDDEFTVEERVTMLEREVSGMYKRLRKSEEKLEMILDDIVTLDERTQPLVALVKAVKGDE